MFQNLLSKLTVVAATAALGLGAVTVLVYASAIAPAPAHTEAIAIAPADTEAIITKTLSGQFENGITYSGSFKGKDKSGGGLLTKDELTAFTMNIFSKEGKKIESLGLKDLDYFAYSDKGALKGDWPFGVYRFWDGFSFDVSDKGKKDNHIGITGMRVLDYGYDTKKSERLNRAFFYTVDDKYSIVEIKTSQIGDLQSVP
jgi:hypothetical protein